jgi:hypothetical protein
MGVFPAPTCNADPVSFDVFFQGFIAGESSEYGAAQMREVLAPHVSEEDVRSSGCGLVTVRPISTYTTVG